MKYAVIFGLLFILTSGAALFLKILAMPTAEQNSQEILMAAGLISIGGIALILLGAKAK